MACFLLQNSPKNTEIGWVNVPKPRYTTFNGVYTKRWKDILRFRAPSEFSCCEVCAAYKTQLADRTLSLEQKLGCLQGYRAHLHDQFCDRTIIWTLQAQGSEPHSGVLMICTDGLDQSKFALPRHPELRVNARLRLVKIQHPFSIFLFSLLPLRSLLKVKVTHHQSLPSGGRNTSGLG